LRATRTSIAKRNRVVPFPTDSTRDNPSRS
jgi:hypothetical protein